MPQWVQYLLQLVLSMYPQPWMAQLSIVAVGAWVAWLIGKRENISNSVKNGLLLGLSIMTCWLVFQVPLAKSQMLQKQFQANIELYEFYAQYEWPLSGQVGTEPIPLSGRTLRAAFKPERNNYRLTPLIRNNNKGIPLHEPRLTLRFPSNIEIQTTTLWTLNLPDEYRELHAEGFGPVLNGAYRAVNESLFLHFPHAGKYAVQYRISGIVQQIAVDVHGEFELDLQEGAR